MVMTPTKMTSTLDMYKFSKLNAISDPPYTCPICAKIFTLKQKFLYCVIKHTGERPYQCQYCEKNYTRSDILLDHLRVKHNIEKSARKPSNKNLLICTICNASYKTKICFRNHMVKEHEQLEPEKCPQCKKTFKSKGYLLNHIKMHTNPFCCLLCGKQYVREGDLKNHVEKNCCLKNSREYKNVTNYTI